MINSDVLKKLLAIGKLDECFETLFFQIETARKMEVENADMYYDSLILLSGQFVANEQDKKQGFIDANEFRLQNNKLNRSLTTYINELPENYFKLSEKKEIRAKASLRELIALDEKREKYEYDVFVSFSHKNEKDVTQIANVLRGYGLRVFIYYESIAANAGTDFLTKINNALQTSQHFVLIATPESLVSDTVKMEYENFHLYVHQKDKKNRKFIIFEGKGFKVSDLQLIFRNTDRVNNPEDLITGLIDIDYLNKRYEEQQKLVKQKLKKEVDDLHQKIKHLEAEIQKSKTQAEVSFRFIEEAKESGYEQAKTEIEQLKKKITQKENEIKLLKAISTENNDNQIKDLQNELKTKKAELTKTKNDFDNKNKENTEKQKKIELLQSQLKQSNENIILLEKGAGENDNKLIKQLKENLTLKEKEFLNFKAETEKKQNSILQNKEQNIEKLENEIQTLKKQIKNIEQKKIDTKEQNTELILKDDYINKLENRIKENDEKKDSNIDTDKLLLKIKKQKKLLGFVFSLVVIIPLVIILVNVFSPNENKTWEKTLQQNNLTAYKSFIDNYPTGLFKNNAIDSVFSINIRKNNIEALRALIVKYPNSSATNNAKNIILKHDTDIFLDKYNKAKLNFDDGKNLINNTNYEQGVEKFVTAKALVSQIKELKINKKSFDEQDLLDAINNYLKEKIAVNENDMTYDSDNKEIYQKRIDIMTDCLNK